jgi:shikimate dehydrogenase
MPLKEVCIDYLDLVEPVARQITSVNTIVFKSGGGNGFSTDLLAFKNLLSPYFGKEIAILGAGGTARAALGALKGTNTKVKILTRSSSRHSKMIESASDTDIAFVDWNDFSSIQNSNLIISTTPKGSTDSFVVNESNADLFEVLYHPWPTKLVENYQRLGKQVIGGLSLLVEQALFQIQKFSEEDFDFDVMRTKLLKVAEQAANK